jgi:transcriptional regulator with XRE-family HTH domain
MMTEVDLGELVRQVRRMADLSQEAVADKANVALSAVRSLEAGKGSSVKTLLAVLNALDRGHLALYLPGGSDYMPTYDEIVKSFKGGKNA